jgi:hypothetical protein
MSFIDDSEKNVKHQLMKEVSGGGVAGFVGGAGMGIDVLFAGPFHPDSGYGSKNKELLAKQLKDRRKKRKDLETDADGVIDDYSGLPDPVGGYYETDTEVASLAYDELERHNELNKQYSDEMTPNANIEWKSTGWNYNYDEIISYIEEKDFINTSKTNMENVGIDIQYDDKSIYAGKNFINKSQTNWKIINRD